jgi:uncharacterized protein
MAAAGADLYRAKVTVTGQGEANRITGFAACLEDALIKVSGAQKLSGDRRLAAYKSKAKDLVTAFSYRDQFAGKPIRDEQGTRDRPYDLTVDFEESKINDILNALGLKPWLSHRPVLAVFVAMEQGQRSYVVTLDGAQSDLQRDALLAAADKRGMLIVLPGAAALAKSNVTGETLGTTPLSALAPVAAEQDAEAVLTGRLVWDDRQLGWPRSGRSIGLAGRTAGSFAASHLMKPSGAASAARRRSCRAMAIRQRHQCRREETSSVDIPGSRFDRNSMGAKPAKAASCRAASPRVSTERNWSTSREVPSLLTPPLQRSIGQADQAR